ncbi:phosphonate ABC transporter ATP-binding protein [Salibacterium halotolerans]|uniref:Phosphonate transport system ATP-binding protein n=1 Tax=Salibacterium halotolerans TaxID=1884432 RepID=A0A1I5UU59_9BACI|nr:phosphonate ABC transporter ATP-binding protein [Salibacterium halotolerans]SFP98739.1 phosphonate transport system ATP-binding protein [Salibacterium halotolerans]
MIELDDVTVYYPKAEEPAVSGVHLSLYPGEFVCVLGPSGAGKSTLIRTINALQPVTEGQVLIQGKNLQQMPEADKRKWRSRAGMIFQHFHLIPRLTVQQNVLTGLFGKRRSFANAVGFFNESEKQKVRRVLEEVGLLDMAQRRVEALSGGQKQRVGIARALMQEPEVFLGDEPVASLDPGTARSVFGILKDVHDKQHLMSLINVHDVALARSFATRVIGLAGGEVIYDGPPDQLDNGNLERIYGKSIHT